MKGQRYRAAALEPEEKRQSAAVRDVQVAQTMPEQTSFGERPWTAIQHHVGNQAVGRILTQGGGIVRAGRGQGPMPSRLVSHRVVTLQRLAESLAVQCQEGEQADQGTVTIEGVQYDYYDVEGSTLAEVYDQLDSEEWGRCHYQYDYTYDSTNGRTTRVNITLRLTIRLPRWQGEGYDNASPAAKAEWRRMLEALEGHEDEHAEIAQRWAPTFQEQLLNQRESRVQQRYNQTLKKVKKEQKQFDQRTRHGQTQGVSLDTSIQ